MSDILSSRRAYRLWERLKSKIFRDGYVASGVSTTVAAQIATMRDERGWTQKQLAEKCGMAQARISLMEAPGYDKFTISTLKRLASAFDVALTVRFEPFSDMVNWTMELDSTRLAVREFDRDEFYPESPETRSTIVQYGEHPDMVSRTTPFREYDIHTVVQ